jgi:hypothetical protein
MSLGSLTPITRGTKCLFVIYSLFMPFITFRHLSILHCISVPFGLVSVSRQCIASHFLVYCFMSMYDFTLTSTPRLRLFVAFQFYSSTMIYGTSFCSSNIALSLHYLALNATNNLTEKKSSDILQCQIVRLNP